MNMAAHDTMHIELARIIDNRTFKSADKIHRAFHLLLAPTGEGPIGQTQTPPYPSDCDIESNRNIISPITQMREPFHIIDDNVEFVAMQNEQALAVSGLMYNLFMKLDATKILAHIIAQNSS